MWYTTTGTVVTAAATFTTTFEIIQILNEYNIILTYNYKILQSKFWDVGSTFNQKERSGFRRNFTIILYFTRDIFYT